jgi:hypothetical protein
MILADRSLRADAHTTHDAVGDVLGIVAFPVDPRRLP